MRAVRYDMTRQDVAEGVVEISCITKSWEQNTHKSELSWSPSLIIWAPSQPCDSQINSVSINEFSESAYKTVLSIIYSQDTPISTHMMNNRS